MWCKNIHHIGLQSGYYHIGLDHESKAKTAFVTPFGKYKFNVVPFGLTQAPVIFSAINFDCFTGL